MRLRTSRFRVGDRVIVTNFRGSVNTDMTGYYGHVVTVSGLVPWVEVSLMGRVGAEARPHDLDPNGDDPWPFQESEVQHAD